MPKGLRPGAAASIDTTSPVRMTRRAMPADAAPTQPIAANPLPATHVGACIAPYAQSADAEPSVTTTLAISARSTTTRSRERAIVERRIPALLTAGRI